MTASVVVATLFTYFLAVSASSQPRADCIVTHYSDLVAAIANCTEITISGITVPAGVTLDLSLKDGTTLTFDGHIKFDYQEWDGPLMNIEGKGITIQGASDHSLDGQGALYWDGLGENGLVKPLFFTIEATGGSVFKDINLLNCPRHCVSINKSQDLTLSNWNIDCSDGDFDSMGHNTDGFGISNTINLVIENTVVRNQDDCVVVNQGSNMKFSDITCYGGHGLSLSVGKSYDDPIGNTVSDILFTNSIVYNSRNGIHIKTHSDATTGYIRNVTYSNIDLIDVTVYGINVQEDYENGDSTGKPKNNIPISDLVLKEISISLADPNAAPVYILCASGGCSNWDWSGISVGGDKTISNS